jgi:hypothetical protein
MRLLPDMSSSFSACIVSYSIQTNQLTCARKSPGLYLDRFSEFPYPCRSEVCAIHMIFYIALVCFSSNTLSLRCPHLALFDPLVSVPSVKRRRTMASTHLVSFTCFTGLCRAHLDPCGTGVISLSERLKKLLPREFTASTRTSS